MRRYLIAFGLFTAGAAVGAIARPAAVSAASSFDPGERSARSLEKIADQLGELRRAAEKKVEVTCDCRK